MAGLSLTVALVEELWTEIGVLVSLATSSWMYPTPSARAVGEPKAELYQKFRSTLRILVRQRGQ